MNLRCYGHRFLEEKFEVIRMVNFSNGLNFFPATNNFRANLWLKKCENNYLRKKRARKLNTRNCSLFQLPRTQTSLWKCARKGRQEGDAVCTLPMVPCGSSPVTRFALASAMRKTKRLRRRLLFQAVSLSGPAKRKVKHGEGRVCKQEL